MTIVKCSDITKYFHARQVTVKAVDGVSFSVEKGETYGLVGESGSGKTTLGKIILGILRPDSGTVNIQAKNIQVIFQDPYNSLDPKMKVKDILIEGLILKELSLRGRGPKHFDKSSGLRTELYRSTKPAALPLGRQSDNIIADTLDLIKLPQGALKKYPHQFSGGERQRIAIGRAVITNPEFIVCDEPVSNLDVTIQLQILKLLKEIQKKFDITYLFISHDLRVIRFMCDRVAVMKDGRIVEEGSVQEVYTRPSSVYTRQLLSSILSVIPAKAGI